MFAIVKTSTRKKILLAAAMLSLALSLSIVFNRPATAACNNELPGDKGLASMRITVDQPGEYVVWLRMWMPTEDQNSVYVQIDDQCVAAAGDVGTDDSFRWVNYHGGDTTSSFRYTLTAGDHVIKITGHDAGTGVDKVLLLQDATCRPVQFGDNCLSESGQANTEKESAVPSTGKTIRDVSQGNWYIVGVSLAVVLAICGFLTWKYKRFIFKVAAQMEQAGVAVGDSFLKNASFRIRLIHFLRHHTLLVGICSGIIFLACIIGIVAAAGRSSMEVESASLYGGAKVVEHADASGGAFVIFEVNPAGASIPPAALQQSGTSPASGDSGANTGSTGTTTTPPGGGGQSSGGGSSTTPAGECPAYPEFPDDSCTGWQHTGVTLQTCVEGDGDEGDGHLEQSNVTYDGCNFANGAVIHGANVTIKRSRIQGVVNAHWSTNYDFQNLTLIDVEIIDATPAEIAAKSVINTGGGSAINGANVTCIRCRIHYVPTGISLGNGSVIRDSYISDVTWGPGAHQAAIGAGGDSGHNSQIIHNRLDCSRWNVNASGFQQGCSSALSLYDEPTLNNVLVQHNLFNTAGGFCTYGGGPQGTNIRYISNMFGKKYNATCGMYGSVSAFYASNGGNVWSDNSWQDGSGAISP